MVTHWHAKNAVGTEFSRNHQKKGKHMKKNRYKIEHHPEHTRVLKLTLGGGWREVAIFSDDFHRTDATKFIQNNGVSHESI